MHPLKAAILGLTLLASLHLIPAAQANIGRRWWGDLTTEPWGLKEVAITREQLIIDLRPLASGQLVRVEVTYELNNAGGSKKLDLLFVSGELGVRDFEVFLGDQPVPAQPLPLEELRCHWNRFPDSWKPGRVPGIDRETYCSFNYGATESVLMEFTLELPPGPSTLRVRYQARACGTDEGQPMVTWQFPYVLAPARDWGSFGQLDVTVHLPEGWQARSTPDLGREGDTLQGRFQGLPADALLLATRSPVPAGFRQAVRLSVALYAVSWACGGFLCWWLGRRQGRAYARSDASGQGWQFGADLRTVLLPIGLPLLWAVAVFVAGGFLLMGVTWPALQGQESPYLHETYLGWLVLNAFVAAPASMLLGIAITVVSASRAGRRVGAEHCSAAARSVKPSPPEPSAGACTIAPQSRS